MSRHLELVETVLRQSEQDLHHCNNGQDINHASTFDGLTALHFAVEWPTGLKLLIEGGANINAKDRRGRRPIDVAAELECTEPVQMLLHNDCLLSTSTLHNSLFRWCLVHPRNLAIVNLITQSLIDRHNLLAQFARDVLPEDEVLLRMLPDDGLMGKLAPVIIDKMQLRGISSAGNAATK